MNTTLNADYRHQQRLVSTLEKRTAKLATSLDDIFTPTERDVLDGFGPGDYSGGYTGQGDTVYWGPSGDGQPMPPAVLNSNTRAGGMTELVPIRTEKTSSGTGAMSELGMTELVPLRKDGIVDGMDFSSLLDARTERLASSIDNIFAEVEPRPATDWSDFDVTTTSNTSSTQPKRSFYEPADWDEDEEGIEMTEMEPGTEATTTSMSSSEDYRFTGDEPLLPLADTTSDAPSMNMDVDFLDEASTVSMDAEANALGYYDDLTAAEKADADRYNDLEEKAPEPTSEMESLDTGTPGGAGDLATNPRTKQVMDMFDTSRGGYTVPRNLDPLFDKDVSMTEMTQLGERPGFTDIAGTMPADAIGGLRELAQITMDEGFGPKDFLMESGAAINPAEPNTMMFNPKMLKNYVIKQAKGTVYSLALSPLINWLNDQNTGMGNLVVAGLAAFDIMNSADPLGAIMFGAQQMIQMFGNAHQKALDDDTPDDKFGTRLGYVREGDTWYPAVYDSKFESTGLLASDGERAMDYGHQLLWGFDGEGNWIPVVPDANNKRFVVDDEVWKDETLFNGVSVTGKEFVTTTGAATGHPKMNNIARDWYLLDARETAAVLLGKKKIEAWTQDPTKLGSVGQQINDWRKALDTGHDWKWSSAIQTMGKGAAVNSYEGSRELQRLMAEGVDYMTAGLRNTDLGDDYGTGDYATYIKSQTDGTGNQDHNMRSHFGEFVYNDVIKDHLEALYRTQRIAAQDAGFEEAFGGKADAIGHTTDDSTRETAVQRKDMEGSTGPTVWSTMYLDTAKDLPTAKDADELKAQLDQIEMMNDRTPNQRNYLSQKVQTRYWLQQATTLGDSEHLFEYLYGSHVQTYTGDSHIYHEDPYGMSTITGAAASEYAALSGNRQAGAEPYYQGFAMPWQNAGEDFLPGLTVAGLEGTNVTDYMSDKVKTSYAKISDDARANSAAWARSTANLNPNSMLEGLSVPLGDSGIYGIDDVVVDETAPAKKTVRWEDEKTPDDEKKPDEEKTPADVLRETAATAAAATGDDDFMHAAGGKSDEELIKDLFAEFNARDELPGVKPKPSDPTTPDDPFASIKLQTLGFKPTDDTDADAPTDPKRPDADAWIKQGIDLGIIDDSFTLDTPGRMTQAQSHVPDVVPVSRRVEHNIGSHHFSSSMGSASWEAVAAYEGHSSGFVHPQRSVKVV